MRSASRGPDSDPVKNAMAAGVKTIPAANAVIPWPNCSSTVSARKYELMAV